MFYIIILMVSHTSSYLWRLIVKKPIILASVERSGSSWLGKILDSNPYTLYKFEPFHPEFGAIKELPFIIAPGTKAHADHLLEGIARLPTAQSKWLDKKPRFPKRFFYLEKARLVFKTVRSSLRLRWMSEVLESPQIVYILRNPFGYVNSLKTTATKETFPEYGDLKKFEMVRRDPYFGKYFEMFVPDDYASRSIIQRETLFWLLRVGSVLEDFSNSETLKIIIYEDLCQTPLKVIKEVFDFLELEVTRQTKEFIRESTMVCEASTPYSIYRNPRESMNKWQAELSEDEQSEIAATLNHSDIMKYWRDMNILDDSPGMDILQRPYYLMKYYLRKIKDKIG